MGCVAGVVGVGGDVVWHVLVELAAVVEGHELHAKADAQCRGLRRVVECFEECEFVDLSAWVDGVCEWVCWLAEGFGSGVVAACEDDGVAELELLLDEGRVWREDDRSAAGVGNGVGVGEGDHRPDAAGLGLGDVWGNPYDGAVGGRAGRGWIGFCWHGCRVVAMWVRSGGSA